MNVDLPPEQYLIMEVLAARYRTGEPFWTFPSNLRQPLDALLRADLVDVLSSPAPGSLRVRLTEAGRKYSLKSDYVPPLVEVYDTAFDQIDGRLADYRGAKALREGVQAAVNGARARLAELAPGVTAPYPASGGAA